MDMKIWFIPQEKIRSVGDGTSADILQRRTLLTGKYDNCYPELLGVIPHGSSIFLTQELINDLQKALDLMLANKSYEEKLLHYKLSILTRIEKGEELNFKGAPIKDIEITHLQNYGWEAIVKTPENNWGVGLEELKNI